MNKDENSKDARKRHAISEYFKEVIYGGIDGIVTTFAVVAGFSGAALSQETTTQLSFLVVLLFGLANLFADAASMGLGNFLSVRSEQDLYNASRRREMKRVRNNPSEELETTIRLMTERGFTEEDARTLASVYQKNEEYWVDFMMSHAQDMSDPRGDNPVLTGTTTFLSFLLFGAIPLLPFIFIQSGEARDVFLLSCAGTFAALVALGLLKWRIIGTRFWPSLLEVVLVGGTAALIAFLVGTFFKI